MSDNREGTTKRLDFDAYVTIVMCVTACVLTALVVFTYFSKENQDRRDAIPDEVIVSFLNEYVLADTYDEEERIVEKYFSDASRGELDVSGRSQTLRDLNAVFTKWRGSATGYEILDARKDYVEIVLLDAEGTYLYPRIGILYNSNGEQISNFNVFRLQPLYEKDPEWRKEWR